MSLIIIKEKNLFRMIKKIHPDIYISVYLVISLQSILTHILPVIKIIIIKADSVLNLSYIREDFL